MPIYSNMPEDFYPRPSDVDAPLRSPIGRGPRGPQGHSITAEIVDNDPYGYFRVRFKDAQTGEVLVVTPNLDVGSRIFVTSEYAPLNETSIGVTHSMPSSDLTPLQASSDRGAVRVGDLIVFNAHTSDPTLTTFDTFGIGVVNRVDNQKGDGTFVDYDVVHFVVTNVITGQIADGSITADMLADDAVTSPKIANGAIGTTELANNAITNDKLANNAVTTDKLANGSVTAPKLADNSVTNQKLANSSVTSTKIADGSVTTSKIANNAVTTDKIANGSVTTQKILDGAVTPTKIPDGTIGTAKLANGSVTTEKIKNRSITLEKLSGEALVIEGPTLADPIEWNGARAYDAFTVVTHNGDSYTSRANVPIGIDISNTDYWVETGNYNAQVEQYKQEVIDLQNTVVLSFDTVSDMKNSEVLYLGAICHTNGFRYANDKGAGWYKIIDNGVANEMDVISCGNFFATLIDTGEPFTPQMYGAIADSSTDVTNIFRKLLNDRTQIYIPSGTYLTNSSHSHSESYVGSLVIKSNTNILIDKNAYIVQLANDQQAYEIILIEDVENIKISGGNIIGDVTTHTVDDNSQWGFGIYINNSNNIIIEDINISECWGDGICINGDSHDITIRNNTLENNRRQGITIAACNNIIIDNNYIIGTGSIRGTNPKAGIDIEPDSGYTNNIIITNNHFIENIGNAIHGFKNANSTITDINISNNTIITTEHSSSNPFDFSYFDKLNISNNIITSQQHLTLSMCTNVVFEGNILKLVSESQHAIFVYFGENININNNTIDFNNSNGMPIWCQAAKGILINSNVINCNNQISNYGAIVLDPSGQNNKVESCSITNNFINGFSGVCIVKLNKSKNVIIAFNIIKNSTVQGIISGGNNTFPTLSIGNNCDNSSIPMYIDYTALPIIDGFNFSGALAIRDYTDISANINITDNNARIKKARMFNSNTVELSIEIDATSSTGTQTIGTINNCSPSEQVFGIVNYTTDPTDIGKICWCKISAQGSIQVWFADQTNGKIEISFSYSIANQAYKQKINS